MKKLIILMLILLVGKFSFGQTTWPIPQNIGSDSTLVSVGKNFMGGLKGNIIFTGYSDTTSANLFKVKLYAGATIFTTSDNKIWYRNAAASAWIEVGSSAGGVNIYNSDGTLTSGRSLSGGGVYDLLFQDLPQFGVSAVSIYFDQNSNQIYMRGDTTSSTNRISYETNIGSTFTRHSLVDKNYVDSLKNIIPTLQQVLATQGNEAVITATTDLSPSTTGIDFLMGNNGLWNSIIMQSLNTHTIESAEISLSASNNNLLSVGPDSIRLFPYLGQFNIDSLRTLAAGDDEMMTWNPRTGVVSHQAIPTSGSITTTDNQLKITGSDISFNKTVQTLTDGATVTWNVASGPNAKLTIGGNRTLDVTNEQNGDYGTLIVVQDATGGRTLSVPNGTVTLNPAAGDTTVLVFFYDGTRFIWRDEDTTSLSGYVLRTELQDTAAAIRADIGGTTSITIDVTPITGGLADNNVIYESVLSKVSQTSNLKVDPTIGTFKATNGFSSINSYLQLSKTGGGEATVLGNSVRGTTSNVLTKMTNTDGLAYLQRYDYGHFWTKTLAGATSTTFTDTAANIAMQLNTTGELKINKAFENDDAGDYKFQMRGNMWLEGDLVDKSIAYNSGSEIVALGIDTLTGKFYRKSALGTSSTVTTTNTTTTTAATITCPSDGAGVLTVTMVAAKTDNTKYLTGEKKVQWTSSAGTVTIRFTTEILADYLTGFTTATWTIDASGSTLRVRVTGEAAENVQWTPTFTLIK